MKLEAIRGFAALYVLVAHFANVILNFPKWTFFLRFATEAVGLFFLISGFVIYYSTFAQSKELVARDYFVKRFRRIYPLFIFSIIVSYCFASVAAHALMPLELKTLIGNLLMLQDFKFGRPGVWFRGYYNPVFWSLSYEWWYYVLFYFVSRLIVDGKKQQYAVFAVALFGFALTMVYPNQPALYLKAFMSWWCGVELAREYCQSGVITWKKQRTTIGLLAIMSAVSFMPVLALKLHHHPIQSGLYPMNDFRLMSCALWYVILGVIWQRWQFVGFRWTFGWFAVVAPISYGIYIFHYPALLLLDKCFRYPSPAVEFVALLGVAFLLAYFFEVRVQRHINRWTRAHLLTTKTRVTKLAP